MDNVGFVAAAYLIAAAIVVSYTWSLRRRLRRARAGGAGNPRS